MMSISDFKLKLSDIKQNDKFIQSKTDLNNFLEIEKHNYGRKNIFLPLFAINERDILWKYHVILRRTEYHSNTNHQIRSLIYKTRLKIIQNKYLLRIPINCFDSGLKIMHLGSILINGKVKVGKNCSIHINTSIVAGGTDNRVPMLGNGIIIGVGAVILGNVQLADNIAIGANAVVNKSFLEKNIAIAGIPAKKISNNGSKEWNKK